MPTQEPLLPDVEPVDKPDRTHEEARLAFELVLEQDGLPFSAEYAAMVASGFRFREAAYVAWSIQPKALRQPPTKGELAALLGCSAGKISKMASDPRLTAMRIKFARAAYMDSLPEIVDAAIEVASTPSYKATPERANITKLLGMANDEVVVRGENDADLSQLTDAELAALLEDEGE